MSGRAAPLVSAPERATPKPREGREREAGSAQAVAVRSARREEDFLSSCRRVLRVLSGVLGLAERAVKHQE